MEEKTEEEIITLKDLTSRHKDINFEDLSKIVLVCKNCGHKDLLINFIAEVKNQSLEQIPSKPYYPTPWKPKKPWKPYYGDPPMKIPKYWCKTKSQINCMVILNQKKYSDYFHCPKCKSSLIVLDKKFIKNNLPKFL